MCDYSKYYKKISEIVQNKYLVRSYQRGYRWDEYNVKCFLDDIFEGKIPDEKTQLLINSHKIISAKNLIDNLTTNYTNNNNDNMIQPYCIQPIVVKKKESENEYIVIDGQQRLTTIYIILQVLIDKLKEIVSPEDMDGIAHKDFKITYESRTQNNNSKSPIHGLFNDSVIDREYIELAYCTAKNWFEDKVNELSKSCNNSCNNSFTNFDIYNFIQSIIIPYFEEHTVVIWDEIIDDGKTDSKTNTEQAIFATRNTGKLDLTDAELIKAIFLDPMNYRENENDKSDVVDSQILISETWDSYENRLHVEDFWRFIPIEDEKKAACENSSRMDIIFRIQAKCCHMEIKERDHELYWEIREWIENELKIVDNRTKKDKILSCWRKICDLFDGIEELYKNNELYNLLYLYKKVLIDHNSDKITNLYESFHKILNENKKERVIEAKKLILDSLFPVKNKGESIEDRITHKVKEVRYYDKGETIRDILFAYNIALTDLDPSKNRFDFKRYEEKPQSVSLERKWDIEHIYSTNENGIGINLIENPGGMDDKEKLQARVDLLGYFKTDGIKDFHREYLEYLFEDQKEVINGNELSISEQIDYYKMDLNNLFSKANKLYDRYHEIWRYLKFKELADYYCRLFEKKQEMDSLLEKNKYGTLSDSDLNVFLTKKNVTDEYYMVNFLRSAFFSNLDPLLKSIQPDNNGGPEWYGLKVFDINQTPQGIDQKTYLQSTEDEKLKEISNFVDRCQDYYMKMILEKDSAGNVTLDNNGGIKSVITIQDTKFKETVLKFLQGTSDRIERMINEFFSYNDKEETYEEDTLSDFQEDGTKINARNREKQQQAYYTKCWKHFLNDNSFGNMMLLDYRINRAISYRNACFDEKRRIAFNPEKYIDLNSNERIYLPVGTQDVYAGRYLDTDSISGRWLMGERKRYIENMIETLKSYFNTDDNGGVANGQ